MRENNLVTKIFLVLFTLSIILHTNSTFQYIGLVSNEIWSIIDCVLAGIIFIFLAMLGKIKFYRSYYFWGFCLILIILSTFSNLFNSGDGFAFGIKYICLLSVLYIIFQVKEAWITKTITNTFINFTIILAILSLFFFIFAQKLNLISPCNQVQVNWGPNHITVNNYFYLHFTPQKRNCGVFVEAPMYVLILSIATIIAYVTVKKINLKIIILLITLITTNTLTAYLFLAFFILLVFVTKSKRPKGFSKQFYIIAPILLIVAIICLYIYFQVKVSSAVGNDSIFQRIDDYIASFKVFIKNPIFGIGYGNEIDIINNMDAYRLEHNITGLANSISVFIAQGGLIMLVVLFSILGKSILYGNTQKRILTITFIFFICVNVFLYTNLFIFCLAYFMSNSEERHKIIVK